MITKEQADKLEQLKYNIVERTAEVTIALNRQSEAAVAWLTYLQELQKGHNRFCEEENRSN